MKKFVERGAATRAKNTRERDRKAEGGRWRGLDEWHSNVLYLDPSVGNGHSLANYRIYLAGA